MWSYSFNPSLSNLDAVRFLIGDTDVNNQLIQNEEINWLLSQEGDKYSAAAAACDAISSKFARQVDKEVGDLSIKASQRSEAYRVKSQDLRNKGNFIVAPYAGGISKSDKASRENNTDRVEPAFSRELMDNPYNSNVSEPHSVWP